MRPQASSGVGSHTTGISSTEAKAPVSRRAGCHAALRGRRDASRDLSPDPGWSPGGEHAALHAGNLGGASFCPPAPSPQRKAALPQSPGRCGVLRARVRSGAALRGCSLGQPRSSGQAGSASRRVRSASRSPALRRSLASHTSPLQPRVRAQRPAGQRLSPGRGARGAAVAPSPPAPAARRTRARQPRRARAHPASSAGTPRTSEPGGCRALQAGDLAPRVPVTPLGAPTPGF